MPQKLFKWACPIDVVDNERFASRRVDLFQDLSLTVCWHLPSCLGLDADEQAAGAD
jgi:hypothetical protein